MRKKEVSLVVLMVLILAIGVFVGCSKDNKSNELKIGRYVIQDGQPKGSSWVSIKENNKFILQRTFASSYAPVGTYTVEGNTLKLSVDEDEFYTFRIDGNKLIFEDKGRVDSLIKEGSIFKLDSNNK